MPSAETASSNFVITRNASDGQIALRPNTTLVDITRLYSRADSDSINTLTGSTIFQTTASIGGVYVCRAQDDFGSRNISVNITVKGSCNLHDFYHCIIMSLLCTDVTILDTIIVVFIYTCDVCYKKFMLV